MRSPYVWFIIKDLLKGKVTGNMTAGKIRTFPGSYWKDVLTVETKERIMRRLVKRLMNLLSKEDGTVNMKPKKTSLP